MHDAGHPDYAAPEIHLYEGGEGSGKTQALASDAARLLAEGIPAADILVVAATPQGEEAFRTAFAKAAQLAGLPQDISANIANPRSIALEIIACDPLTARRDARLMMPYEEDALLDDLKTSGIPPKRLTRALPFLFRGWADIANDDPTWPARAEDREIHQLLQACLEFSRSAHPAELSNLALKCLRQNSRLAQDHGAAYVFVDDFTLLNRASQHVVKALARNRLTLTASTADCLPEAFDPHPYAQGLRELKQNHPLARITSLERDAAPAPQTIIANTPQDEAASVVDAVARFIREGTSPADIFVACPNRAWAGRMARALAAAQIPVRGTTDARAVMRSAEISRACALIMIAADESDGGAWRSWCGFGAHLSNDSAMRLMREQEGPSLIQAFPALKRLINSPGNPPGTQRELERVREAYERGGKLAAQARTLHGLDLITFLADICCDDQARREPLLRALEALCRPQEGDGAAELAQTLAQRTHFPAFPRENAVAVGLYAQACGLSPTVVVATEVVGGIFPTQEHYDEANRTPAQRERALEESRALLEAARKRARRHVITTGFNICPLESAEQSGLKVRKIRFEQGKRVALVEPSPFVQA